MKKLVALLLITTPVLAETDYTSFQDADYVRTCYEAKEAVILSDSEMYLVMFKGKREGKKNEGYWFKSLDAAKAMRDSINKRGEYCEAIFNLGTKRWIMGIVE